MLKASLTGDHNTTMPLISKSMIDPLLATGLKGTELITMTPTLHMEIKELTALQDVLDAMTNSHPMVPFNSLQLAIPTVMSAIAITISHLPWTTTLLMEPVTALWSNTPIKPTPSTPKATLTMSLNLKTQESGIGTNTLTISHGANALNAQPYSCLVTPLALMIK